MIRICYKIIIDILYGIYYWMNRLRLIRNFSLRCARNLWSFLIELYCAPADVILYRLRCTIMSLDDTVFILYYGSSISGWTIELCLWLNHRPRNQGLWVNQQRKWPWNVLPHGRVPPVLYPCIWLEPMTSNFRLLKGHVNLQNGGPFEHSGWFLTHCSPCIR